MGFAALYPSCGIRAQCMIRKNVKRFSEKIMLKQHPKAR